jgi:hypothetical protein
MLRTLLATTAVSVALATGAVAQQADTDTNDEILLEDDTATTTDDPATADDPAEETDDPAVADEPATGTDEPALADDPAMETDEPGVADDPATATDEPGLADEPGMDAGEPALADDPTMETDDATMADEPAMEADEPAVADDTGTDAPSLAMPGEQTVDLSQVPGEELVGSEVRGFDDEQIATVDDVVDNGMGEVQSILVRFGGFLGFGATTVELQPGEFEVVRGEEEDGLIVRTSLSQEELENRPEAQN